MHQRKQKTSVYFVVNEWSIEYSLDSITEFNQNSRSFCDEMIVEQNIWISFWIIQEQSILRSISSRSWTRSNETVGYNEDDQRMMWWKSDDWDIISQWRYISKTCWIENMIFPSSCIISTSSLYKKYGVDGSCRKWVEKKRSWLCDGVGLSHSKFLIYR